MAFKRSNIFMFSCAFLLLLAAFPSQTSAAISKEVLKNIKKVNSRGEHYAVVSPTKTEYEEATSKPVFNSYKDIPTINISGRCFHVGDILGLPAIVVFSGSGTVNAAQTTQLLVTLFNVTAVINIGRAGATNPNQVKIGYIVFPKKLAHVGVVYWEKYGGDQGSFDHKIANLTFADYNEKKAANALQRVYFQPEVIYSTPGIGEEIFFTSVDGGLHTLAQKMEGVDLDNCTESGVCLENKPMITTGVEKGCSADVYVNNVAYRNFLRDKIDCTTTDTESAVMALVCLSEKKRFIAMRLISNFAGGEPSEPNDLKVVGTLVTPNIRTAILAYFDLLKKGDSTLSAV